MADPPPYPDTGDDAGVGPAHGSTTGTPRWVKVLGTFAIVLVVLAGVMLLTGGPGGHGPSRHTGPGDAGERTQPPAVPEGHRPPPGVPEHGGQGP